MAFRTLSHLFQRSLAMAMAHPLWVSNKRILLIDLNTVYSSAQNQRPILIKI